MLCCYKKNNNKKLGKKQEWPDHSVLPIVFIQDCTVDDNDYLT